MELPPVAQPIDPTLPLSMLAMACLLADILLRRTKGHAAIKEWGNKEKADAAPAWSGVGFCGGVFLPTLSQPGLFGIGKFGQHHHRLRHIRFVPTKSSDFRAVKIHGKTELDALHDASVAPTLR